jgi:hypothetical protein
LYNLTYDLWNEIIDDVVIVHESLFEAMHQAADHLKLSKAFVEDLKRKGVMEIGEGIWNFLLKIEFIDDKIEGFRISLLAAESTEDFEEIKAKVAADQGFSLEEVEGFELEHGLELEEDIFEKMEASYGVIADVEEDEVIFELVIFDSQDLDNSLKRVGTRGEEPSAN